MATVNLVNVYKEYKNIRINSSEITRLFLSKDKRKREHKWALKDISFKLEKGDSLGLLGLNSSGKTTLLKIIANIIKPTKGICETQGRVVYFSVMTNLYHKISLKDNLYVYGALLGRNRAWVNQILKHPAFSFWIMPFLNLNGYQWSSGVFVRATFLMAILLDADVLLIDEGPVFTDIEFQSMVFPLLDKMKAKGASIMMASHNFDFMDKVCDQVILLDKGGKERTGDMSSVRRYYAQKYETGKLLR